MSSVPVQFLIYVMPEPTCSNAPIILPLSDCLEVTVGVTKTFNLSVVDMCDVNITTVAAIIVSQGINGMEESNLEESLINASLSYATFTRTPQTNQIESQQLCVIAYTDEQVQSDEYCVTFNVIISTDVCKTTTTTSTSSASTSTNAVIITGFVVQIVGIGLSIIYLCAFSCYDSLFMTWMMICDLIAAIVTTTTTTAPGNGISWGLIAGILSAALPLALCTGCCLYRLLWSPDAKRRRQLQEENNRSEYNRLTSSTESTLRTTASSATENCPIEVPRKSYQVYNILSQQNTSNSLGSTAESEGSILVAIYNNTNAKRMNSMPIHNSEQSFETGNAWMQTETPVNVDGEVSIVRRATISSSSTNKILNTGAIHKTVQINRQLSQQENRTNFSSPSFSIDHVSVSQSPAGNELDHNSSRIYLFGQKHDIEMSRITKPS